MAQTRAHKYRLWAEKCLSKAAKAERDEDKTAAKACREDTPALLRASPIAGDQAGRLGVSEPQNAPSRLMVRYDTGGTSVEEPNSPK